MFTTFEDAAAAEVDPAEAIAEIRRHGFEAERIDDAAGVAVRAWGDGETKDFRAGADGLLAGGEILAWLGY